MAVCPKCSTENDDVDFCANCGTYLRWDPTRIQPAVKAPDPEPEPEPAPPPAAVATAPPPAETPAAPPPAETPAAPVAAAAAAAAPVAAAAAPAPPAAAPPPAETPPVADAVPPPQPTNVDLPAPAAVMRTMDMPVIRAGEPPPPGAEGMPALVTPEAVQITPTYPELPGGEQKLVVEAGGRAALPVVVRNQSGIVDNYEIQVRGMPAEWWKVAPPAVYLVPFGAPSGSYEQEVSIGFNPPRSAEAEARMWDLEIVAISRAQNQVAGTKKAAVQITPYEELESELRPQIVAGRRRGEFALAVRNRANAPLDTEISAVDSANALSFDFQKSQFVAEPGRRDGTTFTAKAKKIHWIGRIIERRFEVSVHGAGTDGTAARPLTATFRQKALIPFWVPIVLAMLLAAAIFALSLIPHKTTVPNLHGMTADAANIALKKANLKPPSQVTEVPSTSVAYLHVVRQNPSFHIGPIFANKHYKPNKVKTGTVVTYWIAEPRVPNLVGATQAEAQKVLPSLKLALGTPKVALAKGKTKVGTIISQSPAAKTPVTEGTTITVVVAVGSGLRTVPNVVGQGIAQASALIKGAGLTPVLSPPPPNVNPTTAKISLQVPGAQTREKVGSAVTMYINPPPPPPTTSTTTTGTTGTNPQPPPPPPPPPPPGQVSGTPVPAVVASVKAAGGNPVVTKAFSALPLNTTVATNPSDLSKVQKGQAVEVIASAGEPPFAYSDGKSIFIASAVNGANAKKIAPSGDDEDEPAWQPNGTLVAYRRGPAANPSAGAIWMVDTNRPGTSAHQMTAGPDDRRPAFSPDGKVIAFIRRTPTSSGGADGDLCFVRTSSTLHQGACIKDPKFNVDRPTWSPDGRAIFVIASDNSNPSQVELGEYTTARPFSSSPGDWAWQGLITSKMHGPGGHNDVIYAAFSPDGTQVALITNWLNNSIFRLFTASWKNDQLGTPQAVVPTVRACEVAWRADGGEIIVTQADNGCSLGQGALVRLALSQPGTTSQVRPSNSQNPAWKVEPTPS
jgi:beta-lactam-binding protein with PASTA domain